jgi:hypothetical protein
MIKGNAEDEELYHSIRPTLNLNHEINNIYSFKIERMKRILSKGHSIYIFHIFIFIFLTRKNLHYNMKSKLPVAIIRSTKTPKNKVHD